MFVCVCDTSMMHATVLGLLYLCLCVCLSECVCIYFVYYEEV